MNFLSKLARSLNDKVGQSNILAHFVYRLLPSNNVLFGKEYRDLKTNIDLKSPPQYDKLQAILDFVVKNVPFYKDMKSVDYAAFPFIDKKIIAEKENDFISNAYKALDYELVTTGGTSGPATQFYINKSRYKKEYAFYHKIWSTIGYKGQLRGVIRNKKLDKNKTFKINPVTREVVFDGFRNYDKYYESIYSVILKYNISYLQGYPSSIYNFFIYLESSGKNLDFVKGIFLSSEIFLKHQRRFLVEELKLPVISVYGHSEKLALAVDFKGDNLYTIIEDYGYVELVDENNNTIKQEGVLGEIVATTFDNIGMPLIRYRTGDYSRYYKYSETENRILTGIQGRWNEMKIYNKDGSFITPTALNLHDELNKYVNGLQYIQDEKGVLLIHIVPNNFYNQKIEDNFYKHFKERMASDAIIRIEKVLSLKKRANGKFMILESSL